MEIKKTTDIQLSYGAGSGNRTHLSSLEGWSISRYTIPAFLERETGLEPATSTLARWRSTNWAIPAKLKTKNGADEGSRTPTPKALDPKSSASANSATSAYFFLGGGWWIRTTESTANRFTVCPLWPLGKSSIFGAGNRTRTYNLLITSQLLYQLSHTSMLFK